MKIKNIISNYTIFHPQLFHLPLRLNEASCRFLYALWFSVEGFGTNTYDFHAKHVHVFGKSRTCFPKRSYVFSVILPPKTKAHVKIYKKPYFNEMLNEKAVPKQSFTRASHQNIPQSMQIVILTLCNLNAWRIDYFEARYGLLPNSKIFFHNNLLNNVLQIFTDLF